MDEVFLALESLKRSGKIGEWRTLVLRKLKESGNLEKFINRIETKANQSKIIEESSQGSQTDEEFAEHLKTKMLEEAYDAQMREELTQAISKALEELSPQFSVDISEALRKASVPSTK